MRKTFIILIFGFITVGCQEKRERITRENQDDLVLVETEDKEMNSAIEKAKSTFKKDFHTALLSNNADFSNFTIKQKFQVEDGAEHIWIGDIQFKKGKYWGIVQNEPYENIGVKLGDSVQVNIDNLTDWMYYDKNIVKGAYTIKVLRKSMSKEELEQMDSEGLIYE